MRPMSDSEIEALEDAVETLHAQLADLTKEYGKVFDRCNEMRAQLAERDAQLAAVCVAGKEVVNRWDSPSWKWDDGHTGHKVHRLRDAIAATRQPTQDKE